ncbi:MAG TPA: TAT-variant-translocated molybdopterin oxidoreductase [Vicinamibacterales bacterium]|jgi:molybdopterin-containing oxidoreductase family iron-sulfur binding subunit
MTTPRAARLWRSLDELADTNEFRRFLDAEFPDDAHALVDPIRRREFLKLMGASLALAGAGACTRAPAEQIVPYVRAPEEFVPGHPLFFATAMSLGGFATGVLVESHLGRPTKIEGNPDHPASLGATDAMTQASILTLYDPDRSKTVTHNGRISTWDAFVKPLDDAREEQRIKKGAGLRILTERVTSPTIADQITKLLADFPQARWHQYEPVTRDNIRDGARLAFGQLVHTRLLVEHADVIVSLDSDLLGSGPSALRDARHFSDRRRPRDGQTMNRLYVLESTPSITGTMADHRVRVPAHDVERAARGLARALAGQAAQSGVPSGAVDAFLDAAARDLLQHRGASLVVAGDAQPASVHALAHAINASLGNVGRTVEYSDPVEASPVDEMQSLADLVADMAQDKVDLLVIVGGNPVFNAPRDLAFGEQLSHVKLRIHLALYEDETSALCHWHVPEAHYLEAWGDTRAFDGTVSIVQPLIAPLYEGKSAYEILAALAGQHASGYDVVREYWQRQGSNGSFDERWQRALNDGFIAGTALPAKSVASAKPVQELLGQPLAGRPAGIELVFRPDPTIWDGRFANNAWLQELPKPMTKLTWDAAALVSPATAGRLGLVSGDVVDLRYGGATLRAPVWILPGQADDSIAMSFGYGRTQGGRVAAGVGVNAYALRTSNAPWFGGPVEIAKTGTTYELVSTQHHFSMEGRGLVRVGTVEQFARDPHFATAVDSEQGTPDSLYPGFQYRGHAWGLSIDLNACIGCGACMVACQAENNIPVVGKSEVARGRSMHWIRIDRYFEGNADEPAIHHEPVLCMHCENAPCELVCPVGATVHSDEGLNQMVYNRCVGTRYCSNNCPYKVRRFNFFQYADWDTPSLKGLRNPDVTVRSRGVMEKCTYCVQRINEAKIKAEREDRSVRDGEIVTACQGVCPAQAIVFGDLNDPKSRVAALRADSRTYGLLTDLGTRPRTSYMARLRNPNGALQNDPDHGS